MPNVHHININESQDVIKLGLTTDNLLSFKEHIGMSCRTASYRLMHSLNKDVHISLKDKKVSHLDVL